MIAKVVIFFLIFMAVLAWFGKMHWIGGKRFTQTKCTKCGRFRIGKGPCSCGGRG